MAAATPDFLAPLGRALGRHGRLSQREFAGRSSPVEKNFKFFEMSAQKIFRKGEPNRVNQPKLT
jgi:hypothetical protein